jgi:hypothetical protein
MRNREDDWCTVSQGLHRVELHMVVTVQTLGRLDASLVEQQTRFTSPVSEPPPTDDDMLEEDEAFQDHLLFSYLWVLGAYELVRALDQRCRADPGLLGEAIGQHVRALKQRFTRIRVPLAKFEPAHAHRETDFHIAWPNLQPNVGVGWRVAPDTVVSRKELADELLAVLAQIPDSA